MIINDNPIEPVFSVKISSYLRSSVKTSFYLY